MTVFPESLVPSGRSYKPGVFPQTKFTALNGATSVVQFGPDCYNSELTLTFSNISDSDAARIIQNYKDTNDNWDNVTFNGSDALDCAGGTMQGIMKENLLKWRYNGPPQVEYTFKDRCNVQCSFIGYLDPLSG